MSDIRFNQWLHQSGTGGVSQSDGGHVGIGTTNPLIPVGAGNTHILNVGVVTCNNISAGSSITAGTFYGDGSNLTGIDSTQIVTGNTSVQTVDTGSDGHVKITTEGSERLRIDSSGRVMIGTGTQGDGLADNLTIADSGNCGLTIRAGSSSLSSIFFADGTGANGYIGQQVYNHADNSLKWIVNGSERLRITSAGLMGLGTNSPNRNLHIHQGDSAASVIQVTNSTTGSSATDGFQFGVNSSEQAFFNMIESADMIFYTAGTERLRIKSDGTIIFANKLTNNASYTSHNTNFYGGDVNTGGVRIEVAHSTTTVSGNTASGAFPHHLLLSNYSGTGSADNRMCSIGFDIPTTSTHANAVIAYQATAAGTGDLQFHLESGNSISEKLRIKSDGNVIIGSGGSWSYPKALNVQGSSGSILSLFNADTTTYAANTTSGIEFKLLTGNTGNQSGSCEIRAFKENGTNGNNARALSFYTGTNGGSPTEKVRISSDGYVTKPAHPSFHVSRRAGNISANNYVTFDQVFHNNGSHYDNTNGRFTAPVSGTYYFSAWNYTGGTSAFQLRINGSVYAEYTWDDTGGCGTWVCPMTAGQYAQIYTRYYSWRGTADYHNGFNGFLIG